MQLAEIDVGRVVAGKYELVRLIGKGAMGEVWLATHDSLGGEFAIKLVKPSDDEEDETAAGRFQLEAQVSAKLSRKTRHIVSVSDHGEEDGLAYLVMELLEGESLEARIKRSGEVELAEVVAIVMQIARALGQAHAESIFHRDLKPANVFLTKDEDGHLLVKLLDFGIARSQKPFNTRSPFTTGKDMVLGTPSYMSPEQARGLDSLDHRCDLWALAVVAYEALTRTIPWEGETVEDIFLSICTHRMIPILSRRADLPPAIEGVFARSFAPKLDARFRTAAELSEAFEVLVDPMAIDAAMGVRPGSPSARQLPVARISSPTFDDAAMQREPSADPVGVAVGGPTTFTRKMKTSGRLVAAAAALATIAIVALALTAFSSRDRSTTNAPPAPTTTLAPTATDHASVPPPTAAAPAPTAEATTPLPATPATPATPAKAGSHGRPALGTKPPANPTAAVTPTTNPVAPATPVTPAVTQRPTPVAAPSAAATARKPADKGEVF